MANEDKRKPSFLRFALSFKSYGIALGLILAAIPFATSGLDLLPSYKSSRSILTFFASLVSLLGVALLFAIRRRIGNSVFPPGRRVLSKKEMSRRRWWGVIYPSILIAVSVISLIVYLWTLNKSVDRAAQEFAYDATGTSLYKLLETSDVGKARLFRLNEEVIGRARTVTRKKQEVRLRSVDFQSEEGVELVLGLTPSVDIPFHWPIEISYVFMFLGAALAFVWFGIIEYLQGELGLEDRQLLEDPYRVAPDRVFTVEKVHDLDPGPAPLFFTLSFSPDEDPPRLVSGPDGPWCMMHKNLLVFSGSGSETDTHVWACIGTRDKKRVTLHTVTLAYNEIGIKKPVEAAVRRELESVSKQIRGEHS